MSPAFAGMGFFLCLDLPVRFARAREALREYPGGPSKFTASGETEPVKASARGSRICMGGL